MSSGRLPASERRDQLLDVALGVFATSGYHEASMNDIAEAAGVTKPVLYQHFDSKRDLYRALLDLVGERMLAAIRGATQQAHNGREMTERGFRAYFRWVDADRNAFKFLFGGQSRRDAEFNEAVRRTTAAAADAIAPLIAVEGIDAEHRMTLAHAIVGLAEGASRRLVERGEEFDPDEISAQVSGLAWAGLRGVHRPSVTPA